MDDKRHAAAVYLGRSRELWHVLRIAEIRLTNDPRESPISAIRSHIHKQKKIIASQCAQARKKQSNDGIATVPEVLDSERLFCIATPSMWRPQLAQMTAPHVAEELPTPKNDRTKGPTVTLIAPP